MNNKFKVTFKLEQDECGNFEGVFKLDINGEMRGFYVAVYWAAPIYKRFAIVYTDNDQIYTVAADEDDAIISIDLTDLKAEMLVFFQDEDTAFAAVK